MAFSIKQIKAVLSENGIPVENLDKTAEEICSRHTADLDSIKEQRDGYKKDAEKLADVQKELDALKNQPDDGYKEKYEREHTAFETFKTEAAKKETLAAKTAAFQDILKDAGITSEAGAAKVLKYSNLDSYELGEDGKFKDAVAILKSVREEWPEQITTEGVRGANTPNPPANSGGTVKTKAEIMAIKDGAERRKAIAENPQLFTALSTN